MGAAPWTLAALMLSGCTTIGPDFVPPTSPVPAQWRETDSTLHAPAPALQGRWWQSFGDPVLSALIEIALRNNNGLKTAGLRVL